MYVHLAVRIANVLQYEDDEKDLEGEDQVNDAEVDEALNETARERQKPNASPALVAA